MEVTEPESGRILYKMKNAAQNLLLIIFKDKTRVTYSVPDGKSPTEIYNYSAKNREFLHQNVDKIKFFKNSPYNIEQIQYYYDEELDIFDEKSLSIDFKIDEFRKQRNTLLYSLDAEFMKSMENDCEECTKHIVEIKNHLRNMPDLLGEELKKYNIAEIPTFDCFNNVYNINVINGGSGYTEAPEVLISAPDRSVRGFQMKAEAVLVDGAISEIKVTQVGSGYAKTPSVSIAKSQAGNTAIAIASKPENDIFNTVK